MKKRTEAGFAILTELIAIGVLFISLMAVVSLAKNETDSLRLGRAFSSRDKVLKSIRMYIALPSAIRNSIQLVGNDMLVNCTTAMGSFLKNQPGDCLMPPNGKMYPLSITGPIVAPQGMTNTSSGMVAGTPTKPVFYTSSGEGCPTNQGSLQCPIQAYAEFRPLCPSAMPGGPPLSRCDVAEAIEIQYTIQKVPGLPTGASALAAMNGNNNALIMPDFKDMTDSVIINVKTITGLDPSQYQLPLSPPPPVVASTSSTSNTTTTNNSSGNQQLSTSSSTSISSSAATASMAPPPPPPFKCPGDTLLVGPYMCSCGSGLILRDAGRGKCSRISI